MTCRWGLVGFASVLVLLFVGCLSLNDEGLALLEFRLKVDDDPYGALKNWNHKDHDPCRWLGVRCIDGKVDTLNLEELSLRGTLAPGLGKLSHLRSLVLYKNKFSGSIPKEIGQLMKLEFLDLRGNNLSGIIPADFGRMTALRHILLCDNKFQHSTPLIELKCDQDLSFNLLRDINCSNRKFKHCIQRSTSKQLEKVDSSVIPIKGKVLRFFDSLPWFAFKELFLSHGHREEHGINVLSFPEPYIEPNWQHTRHTQRRIMLGTSSNIQAASMSTVPPLEVVFIPSTGSGTFPAVPTSNAEKPPVIPQKEHSSPDVTPINDPNSSDVAVSGGNGSSNGTINIIVLALPVIAIFSIIVAGILVAYNKKVPKTVAPCKTGLSGPLQKALVEGVQNLKHAEMVAACEDFSNIIRAFPFCTIYKGTLSSGVEVAVVSTTVAAKDWSRSADMFFRKKLEELSRLNHKNFVNLLGYCEEDEPFARMMVFEYPPNGTLYELLHGKDSEPLDWDARMRIVMGAAYCLQYMHQEVDPPIVPAGFKSKSIYLTEDYAAKVIDRHIWKEMVDRSKSVGGHMEPSEASHADPGTNVYNFGLIMLETISGRLPQSEEDGSILNWASDYLNDKEKFKKLIDPSMKGVKDNELETVCEAIQGCIDSDPKNRLTMKEITDKLSNGLGITPQAAYPRLSPLWWAELELLSVEV